LWRAHNSAITASRDDPAGRARRNRGVARVPCRAGARVLLRLHRDGAAAPDCCSDAAPAARHLWRRRLLPVIYAKVGKHRIARSRGPGCCFPSGSSAAAPRYQLRAASTLARPRRCSGLAPDDETSGPRPKHQRGQSAVGVPQPLAKRHSERSRPRQARFVTSSQAEYQRAALACSRPTAPARRMCASCWRRSQLIRRVLVVVQHGGSAAPSGAD
jgi:hypothetical protein